MHTVCKHTQLQLLCTPCASTHSCSYYVTKAERTDDRPVGEMEGNTAAAPQTVAAVYWSPFRNRLTNAIISYFGVTVTGESQSVYLTCDFRFHIFEIALEERNDSSADVRRLRNLLRIQSTSISSITNNNFTSSLQFYPTHKRLSLRGKKCTEESSLLNTKLLLWTGASWRF